MQNTNRFVRILSTVSFVLALVGRACGQDAMTNTAFHPIPRLQAPVLQTQGAASPANTNKFAIPVYYPGKVPLTISGPMPALDVRSPNGKSFTNVTYQPATQADSKLKPIQQLSKDIQSMPKNERVALNKALTQLMKAREQEPERFMRLMNTLQEAMQDTAIRQKTIELQKMVHDYVLQHDAQDAEALEKLKKPKELMEHNGMYPIMVY